MHLRVGGFAAGENEKGVCARAGSAGSGSEREGWK